jgi:hypothetical protein
MKPAIKKLYDKNISDFGHLPEYQIMGLTIYAEARGEIYQGRLGVGTVILERVKYRNWDGQNIKDVCLWPYQFSCYLSSDPNRVQLLKIAKDFGSFYQKSKSLQECSNLAKGLIEDTINKDQELAESHCCQYLTASLRRMIDKQYMSESDKIKKAEINAKRWWKDMHLIKVIGAHEFYVG